MSDQNLYILMHGMCILNTPLSICSYCSLQDWIFDGGDHSTTANMLVSSDKWKRMCYQQSMSSSTMSGLCHVKKIADNQFVDRLHYGNENRLDCWGDSLCLVPPCLMTFEIVRSHARAKWTKKKNNESGPSGCFARMEIFKISITRHSLFSPQYILSYYPALWMSETTDSIQHLYKKKKCLMLCNTSGNPIQWKSNCFNQPTTSMD